MINKFKRVVRQTTQKISNSPETETSEKPNASLFECQSCGTVYIATEKQTCKRCEMAVEEVPATLDDR